MLPLFTFVCFGLDVSAACIHRIFKLDMMLRLKKPSLIKFDMVSNFG
jgi:hypothetical protein